MSKTDSIEVTNCINYGSINTGEQKAGGIVGEFATGTVTGCSNLGSVSSVRSDSANSIAGGICGKLASGSIENVYNEGAVSGSTPKSGGLRLGGICGLHSGGTIETAYNKGDVYLGSGNCGGVVGMSSVSNAWEDTYYYKETESALGGIGGVTPDPSGVNVTTVEVFSLEEFIQKLNNNQLVSSGS